MKHSKIPAVCKIKRTKTMDATIKEASEYLLLFKHHPRKRELKKLNNSLFSNRKIHSPKKKIIKNRPKNKKNNVVPIIPLFAISNPLITIQTNPLQTQSTKETVISHPVPLSGPIAGMIDVVFCCDTTASMGSYLLKTKEVIMLLIEKIALKVQNEAIDLKFGFVCYRDHPPEDLTYVIQAKNLCSSTELLSFLANQNAAGGGDLPEAVLDGLWEAAANMSWRNPIGTPTLRYIIHIADAPPHGELYGMASHRWKEGCPCGLTIEKIAHVINMREIHYRLVKAGVKTQLEVMGEVFKKFIGNYLEIDLEEASELDIKVSDMIIRELLPEDPKALLI